ncbi:hypothetical protein HG536_0D01060 [Torulaspora globosa]|uniref:USP domain-containing protein n=1 Tax=Torulaspora globosa TaxID=48254 RepID=A0A7G3ZGE8_9SACH|nr:uncharacterized protein HG536_0D01060 [Torulaspora globosa]QLL32584.1 hypothetical protein HG536_0D01060 [Torulaspora globosa]
MPRVVYHSVGLGSNVNRLWLDKFVNSNSKIIRRLGYGLLVTLSLYILTPTIDRLIFGPTMFSGSSKRSDKYTTGLINNRNDCFANSSVQALASLPRLTSYLNDFLRQVAALVEADHDKLDIQQREKLNHILDHDVLTPKVEAGNPIDAQGSLDRVVSSEAAISRIKSSNSISTLQDEPRPGDHTPALSTAQHSLADNEKENDGADSSKMPRILMHQGLAKILSQLQETISSSRHISVWPLLHILEIIFNAKISTGQNDAHELTQIILETLQKENLKVRKYVKANKFDVELPELPFGGELADHLVCLRCTNSSKVNVHPFIIYPLTVPQTMSARLSDMVSDNQTDTIEGYSCLTCKVSAIISNEKARGYENTSAEERKIIETLQKALPDLSINDELSHDLTSYINSYNKDGVVPASLKSTIVKKTVVVRSPSILVMHLSRSMFDGMSYARNSCGVAFEETLESREQVIRNNKCVGINPISYRLSAIVKHTGSHSQGHYECYRHKPDFVKDVTTKAVINRSPVIDTTLINADHDKNANGAQGRNGPSPQDFLTNTDFSLNSSALSSSDNSEASTDDYIIEGADSARPSRKPSALQKITGYLSRRGSVSTDTEQPTAASRSRAASIATSDYSRSRGGSIASAQMERTVSTDSQSSFFNSSESNVGNTSASDADALPGDKRLFKKIKSVASYPYWHVSDAKVKEAKTDQVLGELRYVYMLYYELIL